MKKIKKTLTALVVTTSMAVGVVGINASAALYGATISRDFYVGTAKATASVSLGGAGSNAFSASTSCSDSNVTERRVYLYGYVTDGSIVINDGYSKNGTASCYVSTDKTFTNGHSNHEAKNGTNNGSTSMQF